jgi:hypothetical protein
MFVIVNSVNIGDCLQIDIMDYQTKQEFITYLDDTINLKKVKILIDNIINNKNEDLLYSFAYVNSNEILLTINNKDGPWLFNFFPKKNNTNTQINIINKSNDIINVNNPTIKKPKLIHPDLPLDNNEKQSNPNTDEISKFKNEIAELKNYLAGLQDFVPKVVLGIFNDFNFIKTPNPLGYGYKRITVPQLTQSKIIEFPINAKEITIPLGQDSNNKLHYDNINLNKLEQFYNLENLTIPSCVFFKEKQFTILYDKNNIKFSEIINQHYVNLVVANMNGCFPLYNVSDVNLPKLKQLELIGCPKKGVFCFLQPQLEKIIINEHNFDYKLPSNFKSIDEVKIDISEFRLNFICPIILNTSNELDIVLRTQCPKLKLIEFNFNSISEMASKYLKKLKKDFCYYYDEEYFAKYGLEVKINIY